VDVVNLMWGTNRGPWVGHGTKKKRANGGQKPDVAGKRIQRLVNKGDGINPSKPVKGGETKFLSLKGKTAGT